MQYGISIPNFGDYGDPAVVVEIAREAEAAGWDGFFLWDHVRLFADSTPPVVDPWVCLAAVAQVTERVKLGPMVTPPARRRPHKLARETVTLDHLSGGRLIFGVGLGAPSDVDFADFGDEGDDKTRAAMLDESLEVITGLWTGEPFAHESAHYRIEEMTFLPPPVQQPRIPIWVAGFWPNRAPMRRAARWDGAFPISLGSGPAGFKETTADDLREIVAYIDEHRTGDGPFDLVLSGPSAADPAEHADDMAALAEAGLTWWVEGIGLPDRSPEEWRDLIRRGPPS